MILEGWKPLTVTAVVDVNVNQISLVSAVVAANLDSSISPPVQVCDLHVGGAWEKNTLSLPLVRSCSIGT